MSSKSLSSWLQRNFAGSRSRGEEVNFPCPVCGHKSFSFNTSKRVGNCFKCTFRPRVADLLEITGESELDIETDPYLSDQNEKDLFKVVSYEQCRYPEDNVKRLLFRDDKSNIWCNDPEALDRLMQDRFLTYRDIERFNIQVSEYRVYVPVSDWKTGDMVNYVGRWKWWNPLPTGYLRYKYAPNRSVTDTFLGWAEARLWSKLVLVENTFNAIWLRDHLSCTTNFGSNLSETQVNLIKDSNIKKVIFLWDEGTQAKSAKASSLLHAAGISTRIVEIKKQPDNYKLEELIELINETQ